MTALLRPPAAGPVDAAVARGVPQPLSRVFADLMPDEVQQSRRLRYVKRRLVFVLVALVLLIGLGDALVRQQTSSAQDDLSAANSQVSDLTRQLGAFDAITRTQADTATLRDQLASVLGNDVSWPDLLEILARPAPPGLKVGILGAEVTDPNTISGSAPDSTDTLPTSTDEVIGSVTMTGVAPSYGTLATYVRALSRIRGLTAVNPATVTDGDAGSSLTFTLTLSLTSAVLSHRYDVADGTNAGGTGTGTGTDTGTGTGTGTGGGTGTASTPPIGVTSSGGTAPGGGSASGGSAPGGGSASGGSSTSGSSTSGSLAGDGGTRGGSAGSGSTPAVGHGGVAPISQGAQSS